jgi:hypothetical protein
MANTSFFTSRSWWRAVRRRAAVALGAAAILGAAACGGSDSSTGPRNADPTGLYALRQVGRDAIPVQIFRGPSGGIPDFIVRVTGGELVLQDDDRFYMAMDLELRANGQAVARSLSVEGDYEIDGGQLMLVPDGAPEASRATIRNGVIALPMDLSGDGAMKVYTFNYVP